MNGQPKRISTLARLSLTATAVGVLACLPLFVRETAYTLVLFMFVGQPLLVTGFLLFTSKVFRDLRRKELL
jgi:hypothetical protein